jgi:hypothetical protein
MQPNQLSYLAAQRQEVTLEDELNRKRLETDGVERHRHLVAVIALYRSFPPFRILHSRAERERVACC